jgi:hypothetical protein
MNTGNYKEVYITRDTDANRIQVSKPNIGIAKFEGCVEYHSASSIGKTRLLDSNRNHGRLDNLVYVKCCNCNTCRKSKETLPFLPIEGTAWLYNTTTGKRTRVDKDMALIDPDTGKVIG